MKVTRDDIEKRLYKTIEYADTFGDMSEGELNAEVDVLMRMIDDYKEGK